jgi:hypothetical protein
MPGPLYPRQKIPRHPFGRYGEAKILDRTDPSLVQPLASPYTGRATASLMFLTVVISKLVFVALLYSLFVWSTLSLCRL